jgi:hypothetical protein
MRGYFVPGSAITWRQYRDKTQEIGIVRTGVVWAECPALDGSPGAHVWVIPDHKYPQEMSAIAVRVFKSGNRQGTAELYENSPSYVQYSCKDTVPERKAT